MHQHQTNYSEANSERWKYQMSGKHAKKKFSARRRFVMGATIAVGGVAIPATFAGVASAATMPASTGYGVPVSGALVTAYHQSGSAWALGWHTGIDLAASEGESVHSAGPGVVVGVNAAGAAYGNHVVVQHDDGKYTLYAHLSSVSVSVGQTVDNSTEVGKAGHTGNASGPHLHFEVRTDPTQYSANVFSDPVAWLAGHGVTVGDSTPVATPPPPVTPPVTTPAPKPRASKSVYTVEPGDTLYDISIAHHIGDGGLDTWKPLYADNVDVVGSNPDLIYPGQRLRLPGDSAPPVSTPPVTPPPVDTPPVTTPPPATGGGSNTPVIAPDAPGTPSGYSARSPQAWEPLIFQAMDLVGMDHSKAAAVESLMAAESGGDPNAINNYDSNAQNGTPSEGLMQVIQPTFDANHVDGTSTNLYDPLANIAAALQYINNQYGGVIPSSPY